MMASRRRMAPSLRSVRLSSPLGNHHPWHQKKTELFEWSFQITCFAELGKGQHQIKI
jgi:hypothetical protein